MKYFHKNHVIGYTCTFLGIKYFIFSFEEAFVGYLVYLYYNVLQLQDLYRMLGDDVHPPSIHGYDNLLVDDSTGIMGVVDLTFLMSIKIGHFCTVLF